MAERRYAILNFSEQDHSVLKSVMSLIEVRTRHQWVEAEPATAHVVFVGMDEGNARQAWDSAQGSVRVWCSRAENVDAAHVLRLPVRPNGLGPLLERLEAETGEDAGASRSTTKAAAADRAPESTDGYYRPDDGMLRYLRQIQEGGVQAVLHSRDYAPLFPPTDLLVDGAAGLFVWPSRDSELAELCAMPAAGIAARRAREGEYQTQAVDLKERPLELLVWLAAVHGSAGAPMEGLTRTGSIRLDGKVSDYSIPLDAEEQRLERLLQDQPRSVAQLAAESGMAEKQVIAFANGCLALGLGRVGDEAA